MPSDTPSSTNQTPHPEANKLLIPPSLSTPTHLLDQYTLPDPFPMSKRSSWAELRQFAKDATAIDERILDDVMHVCMCHLDWADEQQFGSGRADWMETARLSKIEVLDRQLRSVEERR